MGVSNPNPVLPVGTVAALAELNPVDVMYALRRGYLPSLAAEDVRRWLKDMWAKQAREELRDELAQSGALLSVRGVPPWKDDSQPAGEDRPAKTVRERIARQLGSE